MNYEDLKTLDELRKNGSITEEEYQREKQKVFDNMEQPGGSAQRPLLGMTENSYLALMHISQLCGYLLVGLGFLAPLVLWMMNKDNNKRVDAQGKEIMNFIISMVIYSVISAVLCLLLVGFLLLGAIAVLQIACAVIAALRANNGEDYVYPLTIRFLK
ncbi:hypothetical protein FACS189451_12350 [Bacteroidia bacterium]|nr:hypothetical protein FACS189446_4850 [Bacteroidia bacterium]GHT64640.1 hypothetical protein FACS189451_12350 [Bacteroidia bacterium]